MLKQYMRSLFEDAHQHNVRNIVRLASSQSGSARVFCDFGAGNGEVTAQIVSALKPAEVHAVESYTPNIDSLRSQGIEVYEGDLNSPLSLSSESFDIVVSNQVIEHLYDTDLFISEMHRVLKVGGTAVVSTENLASWHNVGALVFGWQPFSLTNISGKSGGIGNPFAYFSGEVGACFEMQHHRLFTTRALAELMSAHGFHDVRAAGAGYYPLPSFVGSLNAAHAHFIAVAGVKR